LHFGGSVDPRPRSNASVIFWRVEQKGGGKVVKTGGGASSEGEMSYRMPTFAPPTIIYSESDQSELLLRGLPWKATVPEVVLLLLTKRFLVREDDVRMCRDGGGKAHGRCVIRSWSRDEAISAQGLLQGQNCGKRYIEAFVRCCDARTTCSTFSDLQFKPFGQMA